MPSHQFKSWSPALFIPDTAESSLHLPPTKLFSHNLTIMHMPSTIIQGRTHLAYRTPPKLYTKRRTCGSLQSSPAFQKTGKVHCSRRQVWIFKSQQPPACKGMSQGFESYRVRCSGIRWPFCFWAVSGPLSAIHPQALTDAGAAISRCMMI